MERSQRVQCARLPWPESNRHQQPPHESEIEMQMVPFAHCCSSQANMHDMLAISYELFAPFKWDFDLLTCKTDMANEMINSTPRKVGKLRDARQHHFNSGKRRRQFGFMSQRRILLASSDSLKSAEHHRRLHIWFGHTKNTCYSCQLFKGLWRKMAILNIEY